MADVFLSSRGEASELLLAAGQVVMGEQDGFLVSRHVQGMVKVMRLTWNLEPGLVHVFVPFTRSVPSEKRGAVLALLNEFNRDPIAGFHLNERDRVIFATYAFLDHDGRLSSQVLMNLFDRCERAITRRWPELVKLLEGA